MNIHLIPQAESKQTGEQRLILNNVTWEQYETLRTTVDDFPGLPMTYIEGTLESITPSPEHEFDNC